MRGLAIPSFLPSPVGQGPHFLATALAEFPIRALTFAAQVTNTGMRWPEVEG
jgi:hypothetical protein